MEKRLHYIDIAKAILIILLLFSHSFIASRQMGHENETITWLWQYVLLFNAFFMQSFFFITGFCSNFNVDFKNFIWKNIKTLLIPSIILAFIGDYAKEIIFTGKITPGVLLAILGWWKTGGFWFIAALFLCKVLYYGINKLNLSSQWISIILLYLSGLFLDQIDIIPNYWFHRHALLMLPYLAFGQFIKNNQILLERWLKPLAIVGFFLLPFEWKLNQMGLFPLPAHDFTISVNFITFPLHIVNVFIGTSLILYVSRLIDRNRFLETFGRGTLFIYLTNNLVLRLSVLFIYGIVQSELSYSGSILVHLSVVAFSIAVYYLLVRIIYSSKKLSWVVGKW